MLDKLKFIFPEGDHGPVRLIDKSKLHPGMILDVRSYGFFGRGIRFAQNIWQKRIRRILGKSERITKPWGNHTAVVLDSNSIGEALVKKGNVVTPVDEYNEMIRDGKIEVRVYEVIGITKEQELEVIKNWNTYVKNRKYDYEAFPRLIYKAMVSNWEDSLNPIKRKIGNIIAGSDHRFWCTQGIQETFINPIVYLDIFCGERNPTPMHVGIRAGEIPEINKKPITLRLIKDVYVDTDQN